MNDIKVVVFDCDGVMFDTAGSNKAFYNHILEHFGLPAMSAEQFAFVHMHTVDESLALLFNDAEQLAAAKAYRKQMNYIPFLQFMRIEPDLKPLLLKLRPVYKTAIATNRTDTMSRVLEEHDLVQLFDLVVTALDVVHPKPHPEQLEQILAHFDVQSHQAIYIGDSGLDKAAANAADVAFIAYSDDALEADFHITRLREIEDILPI